MLLLATTSLPEGEDWAYELKLDGYRAITFKNNGRVHLRSRNNKDFAGRYPAIATALQKLPDETVIDGEVVAFDDSGRPSFNTLQNFGSSTVPLFYYAFDVLILGGLGAEPEDRGPQRPQLRLPVAVGAGLRRTPPRARDGYPSVQLRRFQRSLRAPHPREFSFHLRLCDFGRD